MPDASSLNGRVAIVTGSTRGIGAEIARMLARLGAGVVVCGRQSRSEGERIAKEIEEETGRPAVAFVGDLAQEEEVLRLVASAAHELGPVDILVNNAGGFPHTQTTLETDLDNWEKLIRINLTTPFMCIRAVLPAMLERKWGRIVNIGSEVARMPVSVNSVAYTAAKAGLVGLTKHVARETAGNGVTANAVNPGSTMTERFASLWTTSPTGLAGFVETIPLGRTGAPEEIAGFVTYLVSDLGGFATGAVFDVNGGRVMW